MSRRKVAYAKKNAIDPEEEGEVSPFDPRDVKIYRDRWVTKEFEIGELLGRGKFGEVKRCTEVSTKLKLAAKFISIHSDPDKIAVKREIEIQSKLKHNRVLQLYDAYEKDRQMCIVMELVEGGELFDRVVDPDFNLTERVAILFMRQIVDGLSYIHSQNVIHLDMKPENVVCVAKTGTRIKIIDFGLALSYQEGKHVKTMAGTLEFMAPEVANFEDVSPATDMWSVGVICYVLVSGLSPFLGDYDNETTCNILNAKFDFDAEEFEAITDGCKDFIKQLLVKDPRKRPTAAECMKHSWLQKITKTQTTRHLSKKFHLKFYARNKWKKAIRVVVAMNRLEKFSPSFMTKKLSNTHIIDHSKLHGAKHIHDHHVDPEPEVDWLARHEERKKQRALERAKLHETSEPSTHRERSHRGRASDHHEIEPSARLGRMNLGNHSRSSNHDEGHGGHHDRIGRMNLGDNGSHGRTHNHDDRHGGHHEDIGRMGLPDRHGGHHENIGRTGLPPSDHSRDNGEYNNRLAGDGLDSVRHRDREHVSPSKSPRTQRRSRNTDNGEVSSRPATRAGRLAAFSGRGV